MILTIICLATKLKISKKSSPVVCLNPCSITQDFLLPSLPYGRFFIIKIHLLPTICLSFGIGTNTEVLFLTKASNSACIKDFYFELHKTCFIDDGSVRFKSRETRIKTFGLKMPIYTLYTQNKYYQKQKFVILKE